MTSHSQDPRTWQRPDDPAPSGSASLVDPEDDLPSSTYAGDFETTKIPQYDSGKHTTDQPAFGLIGEPEPLPYVQPGAQHVVAPYSAEPAEIGPGEPIDDRVRTAGRRGTQDLGLLLLRVGFGALLIAHGLQKAFGWWGGRSLGGFQDSLTDLGYRNADILTYLAAGTERSNVAAHTATPHRLSNSQCISRKSGPASRNYPWL